MGQRTAKIIRRTKETDITVKLNLDGKGKSRISTGIRFLDHMLETLSKHGHLDLELKAKGDVDVDTHHTNEDVAIALGEAFKSALGNKKGIRRFADFRAPLDEALSGVRVSIDISGRGSCHFHTNAKTKWVDHPALRAKANTMGYTLSDAKHFMESFAMGMGLTLHVDFIAGEQPHHVIEATFKALAKCLLAAVDLDPRMQGIPSTKGKL